MEKPIQPKYELIIVNERIWNHDCARIPKADLKRIIQKIELLEHNAFPNGVHVKQLQNYHVADYRLRWNKYRVLFNRNDAKKQVLLLRVLHRSKLY